MSELYLIRHAQASFGTGDYDQLSELGFLQSRLLGEYFSQRGIEFDHLVSGDMRRQQQTLDIVVEGLKVQDKAVRHRHPGFDEYGFEMLFESYERDFQDDELVRAVVANRSDMKVYFRLLRRVLSAWSEGRLEDVGETWSEFEQRVRDARSMLHELATSGSRVLVISSGGAISQFVGSVLMLSAEKVFDLNLQMRNTGISHFYFNRSKMNLSGFNAVPHLDFPERANLITFG
jgi:broad specificity phosphatase PhoE